MTNETVEASARTDKWRLVGAALLVLGSTSSVAQLVAREALAPGVPLAIGENGWSSGGLVALLGSAYVATRSQNWDDFKRLIPVPMLVVVAAVALMHVASSSPDGSNGVPVDRLGRAECEAKGHDWTLRGCLTEAERSKDQAKSQKYSKEAAAAMRQKRERERFEENGWSSFESGIGADGLVFKPFTSMQYKRLTDSRCTETSCVAMVIHSDSATACPKGLVIEGSTVVGKTIVEFAKGTIEYMPAYAEARLVIGLREGTRESGVFEVTTVKCL